MARLASARFGGPLVLLGTRSKIAVLLDRDGVLVRSRRDYLRSPLELDLLPGAAEAVLRLKAAGHPVMVVTNQSAVGRGLISIEQVDAIHAALSERLAEKGAAVDGFFVCPHTPWEGCACRKPQPGLLHEAAQSVNCD